MLRDIISSAHAVVIMFSLVAPGRDLPPVPSISGQSTWGKVEHIGRDITITGNATWTATGHVRPDGMVVLYWVSDGRPAVGLYRIEGENLVGVWGWTEDVVFEDGDLCGDGLSQESIRINREK